MSLPERKHTHDKESMYDRTFEDFYEVCTRNCPACIEEARDKEWAKWILDRLWDKCGSTAVVITEPADFEALKKLAESEK